MKYTMFLLSFVVLFFCVASQADAALVPVDPTYRGLTIDVQAAGFKALAYTKLKHKDGSKLAPEEVRTVKGRLFMDTEDSTPDMQEVRHYLAIEQEMYGPKPKTPARAEQAKSVKAALPRKFSETSSPVPPQATASATQTPAANDSEELQTWQKAGCADYTCYHNWLESQRRQDQERKFMNDNGIISRADLKKARIKTLIWYVSTVFFLCVLILVATWLGCNGFWSRLAEKRRIRRKTPRYDRPWYAKIVKSEIAMKPPPRRAVFPPAPQPKTGLQIEPSDSRLPGFQLSELESSLMQMVSNPEPNGVLQRFFVLYPEARERYRQMSGIRRQPVAEPQTEPAAHQERCDAIHEVGEAAVEELAQWKLNVLCRTGYEQDTGHYITLACAPTDAELVTGKLYAMFVGERIRIFRSDSPAGFPEYKNMAVFFLLWSPPAKADAGPVLVDSLAVVA